VPLPRRGRNPDALRCSKIHLVRAECDDAFDGARSVSDPARRRRTPGPPRGRCTGAIPRNKTGRNNGSRDRRRSRSARASHSVHRRTSASSRSPPPVAKACTTRDLRRCWAAGHRRLQTTKTERGPGTCDVGRASHFLSDPGGLSIGPGAIQSSPAPARVPHGRRRTVNQGLPRPFLTADCVDRPQELDPPKIQLKNQHQNHQIRS